MAADHAAMAFDEATARRVEAIYDTADVQRRRRLVREALAAQPGERILDVGCGPGFYLAEVLEQVGPAGRVEGVEGVDRCWRWRPAEPRARMSRST